MTARGRFHRSVAVLLRRTGAPPKVPIIANANGSETLRRTGIRVSSQTVEFRVKRIMSSSESLKTYSYPDGRVKAFDRFDDWKST